MYIVQQVGIYVDAVCAALLAMYVLDFFFFSSRRRHTRFDCDWSSDVCSSDLARPSLHFADGGGTGEQVALRVLAPVPPQARELLGRLDPASGDADLERAGHAEIGRASCRERV